MHVVPDIRGRYRRLYRIQQVRTAPNVFQQRAYQRNPFKSDQSPKNASKQKPEEYPMQQLLPLAPPPTTLLHQPQVHHANGNSSPQERDRIFEETADQNVRGPNCEVQRSRSHPDFESVRSYDVSPETRYNSQ